MEKEFCIIRIQKMDGGVKIYCKSERLEEAFRSIAKRNGNEFLKSSCSSWEGIEGYKVEYDDIPTALVSNAEFTQWGKLLLLCGKPNLSFLRAIGLSEGVEFMVKGIYSIESLQEWIEKTKIVLQDLHKRFFKPLNNEIIVKEGNDGDKKS